MSLQTTIASAAYNAADRQWKRHLGHCIDCARVARKQRGSTRCVTGSTLFAAAGAAKRELERERADDKAPNPDQEPLF